MIDFEDRTIPDDPTKLVGFLRDEAKRVVVEDYHPSADRSSLDWVQRLVAAHPEIENVVEDAYERLLTEAEPRVVAEILFQTEQRSGSMPARLVRVLVEARDSLSQVEDPTHGDGRTLLGALVAALARFRPELSPAAVEGLASIDRREDGWPTSLRLALIAAPKRFLDRVNKSIADLDEDELSLFLAAILNDGGAATNEVLDEIGKAPSHVRDRAAIAIKRFLEQSESDRQQLIASGTLDRFPGEIRERVLQPREDKWPGIAQRLRVSVDIKVP